MFTSSKNKREQEEREMNMYMYVSKMLDDHMTNKSNHIDNSVVDVYTYSSIYEDVKKYILHQMNSSDVYRQYMMERNKYDVYINKISDRLMIILDRFVSRCTKVMKKDKSNQRELVLKEVEDIFGISNRQLCKVLEYYTKQIKKQVEIISKYYSNNKEYMNRWIKTLEYISLYDIDYIIVVRKDIKSIIYQCLEIQQLKDYILSYHLDYCIDHLSFSSSFDDGYKLFDIIFKSNMRNDQDAKNKIQKIDTLKKILDVYIKYMKLMTDDKKYWIELINMLNNILRDIKEYRFKLVPYGVCEILEISLDNYSYDNDSYENLLKKLMNISQNKIRVVGYSDNINPFELFTCRYYIKMIDKRPNINKSISDDIIKRIMEMMKTSLIHFNDLSYFDMYKILGRDRDRYMNNITALSSIFDEYLSLICRSINKSDINDSMRLLDISKKIVSCIDMNVILYDSNMIVQRLSDFIYSISNEMYDDTYRDEISSIFIPIYECIISNDDIRIDDDILQRYVVSICRCIHSIDRYVLYKDKILYVLYNIHDNIERVLNICDAFISNININKKIRYSKILFNDILIYYLNNKNSNIMHSKIYKIIVFILHILNRLTVDDIKTMGIMNIIMRILSIYKIDNDNDIHRYIEIVGRIHNILSKDHILSYNYSILCGYEMIVQDISSYVNTYDDITYSMKYMMDICIDSDKVCIPQILYGIILYVLDRLHIDDMYDILRKIIGMSDMSIYNYICMRDAGIIHIVSYNILYNILSCDDVNIYNDIIRIYKHIPTIDVYRLLYDVYFNNILLCDDSNTSVYDNISKLIYIDQYKHMYSEYILLSNDRYMYNNYICIPINNNHNILYDNISYNIWMSKNDIYNSTYRLHVFSYKVSCNQRITHKYELVWQHNQLILVYNDRNDNDIEESVYSDKPTNGIFINDRPINIVVTINHRNSMNARIIVYINGVKKYTKDRPFTMKRNNNDQYGMCIGIGYKSIHTTRDNKRIEYLKIREVIIVNDVLTDRDVQILYMIHQYNNMYTIDWYNDVHRVNMMNIHEDIEDVFKSIVYDNESTTDIYNVNDSSRSIYIRYNTQAIHDRIIYVLSSNPTLYDINNSSDIRKRIDIYMDNRVDNRVYNISYDMNHSRYFNSVYSSYMIYYNDTIIDNDDEQHKNALISCIYNKSVSYDNMIRSLSVMDRYITVLDTCDDSMFKKILINDCIDIFYRSCIYESSYSPIYSLLHIIHRRNVLMDDDIIYKLVCIFGIQVHNTRTTNVSYILIDGYGIYMLYNIMCDNHMFKKMNIFYKYVRKVYLRNSIVSKYNAYIFKTINLHTHMINKMSIYKYPDYRKINMKYNSSLMNNFWQLIFDLYTPLDYNQTDKSFSDSIIDYINKYIFYYQDYINDELNDYRIDFSRLKNVSKNELILKSNIDIIYRIRFVQYTTIYSRR